MHCSCRAHTLTETNSDSCQTIVSVDVTVNPRPATPVTSLTQTNCAVATGTINVTNPAPAVGITYSVTGTNPVVATITNSTGIFAGLAPGIYDVTTSNSYTCQSVAKSDTINVQPITPDIPIASIVQPSCSIATATVNVTFPIPEVGVTYFIVGAVPVIASISNSTGIFAGLNPGVYNITTTNSDGCISPVLNITINSTLSTPDPPSANKTQPSCSIAIGVVNVITPLPGVGITYTITGTNPVVSSVTNATGVFNGLATGVYNLTTTNATACISSATAITINVQPLTPNTSPILHN